MMKDCPSPDENLTKWSHHAAHSTAPAGRHITELDVERSLMVMDRLLKQMPLQKFSMRFTRRLSADNCT